MRTALTIAIGLVVVLVFVPLRVLEGPFALLFGWIPFLWRSVEEVKPDGPSVVVGAIAILLFATGVHRVGRSWRGAAHPGGPWRARWTVAVVLGVLLLFTAGISMIGITHQVAWLATSEQPLVGEGLNRSAMASYRTKEIVYGLHNYHDQYNKLPPGGTFTPNGEALHSWETHILIFMGIAPDGIDMKRPWNAPEHEKYFKCVIPQFINPEFRTPPLTDADGYGLSHYAANSRVMSANKSIKLSEITNGTENTILVGEVNTAFKPWGHPVNWRDPAAGLNQGPNTFGGPTKSGTTFLMADGSVRFVGSGVDPAVLRAMSDPRAGK